MTRKSKSSNLLSVEHLKERIEDIETWYLHKARVNRDTKMVEHWTKILNTYKDWIHFIEKGQVFNVEVVKIDKPAKKKSKKRAK